jgi:hypothetical protein
LPDSEHAFVGTKRKVDEAVVVGEPAFQYQDVPVGVEPGNLSKGLVAPELRSGNDAWH